MDTYTSDMENDPMGLLQSLKGNLLSIETSLKAAKIPRNEEEKTRCLDEAQADLDKAKVKLEEITQKWRDNLFEGTLESSESRPGRDIAWLASFPELNANPILEIDLDGRVNYINPFARKLFPDIEVKGVDHAYLAGWRDFVERMRKEDTQIAVREIQVENRYFQQSVHFVQKYQHLRVYGMDITRKKQAEAELEQSVINLKEREKELHKLNRTLRAIGNCNQAILRAKDEKVLMEEVCKIVVEDCGHAMAWIGFAIQDEDKTVQPVASAGFEEGYLETLHITWADVERGRGPTGTALRTGKPCICRNMLTDPAFVPWRAEAIKRGYASSIVLPLSSDDKVFGALNIYSKEPDPFSEDEVKLLTELAKDLSYGIATIRLRVAHLKAEEDLKASEERYRSLFTGMTEGFALHEILCDENDQPCDYRFLEINPSFERLTGLRRDDVIGKLHSQILPDDDPNWAKIYGEVALTGRPVHFENYSEALKQHYEVFAYCPAPRQFAVLFLNVTERKRSEELLRQRSEELEAARAEAENEKRRLEAVMESLPVGVAITDPQGGNITSNSAFNQIWGGPHPPATTVSDYVAYKAWWADTGKLLAPEEWASAQVLKLGKPVVGQLLEIQRIDGSRAFVFNSASPVHDSTGKIVGSAVAIQDITDLRKVEQALADTNAQLEQRVKERTEDLQTLNEELTIEISERKQAEETIRLQAARTEILAKVSHSLAAASLDLQSIFDVITKAVAEYIGDTCGIFFLSEDGQQLNPAALYNPDPELQERLYQTIVTLPLRVGADIPEQITPDGRPLRLSAVTPKQLASMARMGYQSVIDELQISQVMVAPMRQDEKTIGAIILIRGLQGAPYTYEDLELLEGLADRAVLSVAKARLYQDLQFALEREQQTRQQLIQAEKNSALARMVASVAHEINNPIQTINNCIYLLREGIHSDSSTDEILEMAASEANRIGDLVSRLRELYKPSREYEPKLFNLIDVLSSVYSLLTPHLQHHNVKWNIKTDTDKALVYGIADQVKQVFINICLNAIAIESKEGSLTVEVSTRVPSQVSISFKDTGKGISPEDMPHIFEPFYTTKEKGSGLGLSICYEIVNNFNGKITVDSQLGQGTTFTVWLPVANG
jgi:PAS domain S-box-containing protein